MLNVGSPDQIKADSRSYLVWHFVYLIYLHTQITVYHVNPPFDCTMWLATSRKSILSVR